MTYSQYHGYRYRYRYIRYRYRCRYTEWGFKTPVSESCDKDHSVLASILGPLILGNSQMLERFESEPPPCPRPLQTFSDHNNWVAPGMLFTPSGFRSGALSFPDSRSEHFTLQGTQKPCSVLRGRALAQPSARQAGSRLSSELASWSEGKDTMYCLPYTVRMYTLSIPHAIYHIIILKMPSVERFKTRAGGRKLTRR